MPSLNLGNREKNDVQAFVESLQANPQELTGFTVTFAHGNEAAWHRFLKGAYNHPITWWIGIFQLQMQMGIWGHQHRSVASTRASILRQLSEPLRNEASGFLHGGDMPILSAIIRYNLKYRKADVAGRFAGGAFTNYASTGGRLGNKALAKAGKTTRISVKGTRLFTNLGLASYGAAIKALVQGHKTLEAIIQSILTGRPEHLPANYRSDSETAPTQEEQELFEKLEMVLSEVMSLSQVAPGPVPIKEFCSRPENINLKGVCR